MRSPSSILHVVGCQEGSTRKQTAQIVRFMAQRPLRRPQAPAATPDSLTKVHNILCQGAAKENMPPPSRRKPARLWLHLFVSIWPGSRTEGSQRVLTLDCAMPTVCERDTCMALFARHCWNPEPRHAEGCNSKRRVLRFQDVQKRFCFDDLAMQLDLGPSVLSVSVCQDALVYCILLVRAPANSFPRLVKVPLITKTSWPKSQTFRIHIEKGPIHIVIKTPQIPTLPRFLRIRGPILRLEL